MSNINMHSSIKKGDENRDIIDNQTISTIPLFIRQNVTIIPIISKTQDSIGRDKKMNPLFGQSEQSYSLPSLKISKEVSITSYKQDNENNVMSMLKNLPNITFGYVNPQPVFKVPETPKLNKIIHKKCITPSGSKVHSQKNIMPNNMKTIIPGKNIRFNNKPTVVLKNKILSERREVNNIIDINPYLIDNVNNFMNTNSKNTVIQKPKKIYENIPLLKNNSKEIITNHLEINSKQYLQYNKQNTSSPKKIFKKSANVSNTISTKDQINIVPVYSPLKLDFTDLNCTLEYDSFVMGISKSSIEDSMQSKTFYNDAEKLSLNEQELESPKTSIPNSVKENVALNSIKTEKLHVNYKFEIKNDEINELRNEQIYNPYFCNDILKKPSVQCNEMNSTISLPVVQKDNQLLQKMRNIFCGNLVEKTPENEYLDYTKPFDKTLQENKQDSSVKCDEYKNSFKRCLSQHEFNKRQKTDNTSI